MYQRIKRQPKRLGSWETMGYWRLGQDGAVDTTSVDTSSTTDSTTTTTVDTTSTDTSATDTSAPADTSTFSPGQVVMDSSSSSSSTTPSSSSSLTDALSSIKNILPAIGTAGGSIFKAITGSGSQTGGSATTSGSLITNLKSVTANYKIPIIAGVSVLGLLILMSILKK